MTVITFGLPSFVVSGGAETLRSLPRTLMDVALATPSSSSKQLASGWVSWSPWMGPFLEVSCFNWMIPILYLGIYKKIYLKLVVWGSRFICIYIFCSGKFIKPPKKLRALKVQESTPDTPRAMADDTMKNRKFSEQEPCWILCCVDDSLNETHL